MFLETFFNVIWTRPVSDRSLRRRALDKQLLSLPMIPLERECARLKWARAETEHLRRTRAIKSKRCRKENPRLKGYESVRVLGQGSFGVVSLVKDVHRQRSSEFHDGAASPVEDNQVKSTEPDGQLFAMKVIRKSTSLRNSQEGHLRAERDFLVASAHARWVVPLIAAFQDHNCLYLVMEYMVGGDFLGLLMREDVLHEAIACWYIAEMVLCIEEAHKMKCIHRDVKPDNFLIGSDGHLKISDFGLAFDGHWAHWQQYHNNTRDDLLRRCNVEVKGDADDIKEHAASERSARMGNGLDGQSMKPKVSRSARPEQSDMLVDQLNNVGRRRLAMSIVGTSQYMAPEVIRGELYDGRCDWWSVGIILYECLFGYTPFYSEDREQTKAKVVDHRNFLAFPGCKRYNRPQLPEKQLLPPVSCLAIDLILQLVTNKENRLSSHRYRNHDLREGQGSRISTKPQVEADFVCANDAEDIKKHSFFRNINWNVLHQTRPPFVPKIRSGQPITKYFEDESFLTRCSNEASSDNLLREAVVNVPKGNETLGRAMNDGGDGAPKSLQVEKSAYAADLPAPDDLLFANNSYKACDDTWDLPDAPRSETGPSIHHASSVSDSLSWSDKEEPEVVTNVKECQPNRKPVVRPRDKILRDPDTSKLAMEIRKTSAFLGYTYRRPDIGTLVEMPDEEVLLKPRRRVRKSVQPLVG